MNHIKYLATKFIAASMIILNGAYAQPIYNSPIELQKQLAGKSKLVEIMPVVENYFNEQRKLNKAEEETQQDIRIYKKWKRWEHQEIPYFHGASEDINILTQLVEAETNIYSGEMELMATTPNWQFVGPLESPYGVNTNGGMNGIGRCDRIAFHPSNPNTIYIGAPNGGLWRTNNNGISWTCLTSYLPVAGVSGVVVSWANPNIIYILSGNADDQKRTEDIPTLFSSAGVFRSTDGGINWTRQIPWHTTLGVAAFQLKQSPVDPNVLIAATSRGLYRTIDGGMNWLQLFTGLFWDIDFVPGTSTFYVAQSGSTPIYRLINHGSPIRNISFGPVANTPIPTPANRISLAVTNVALNANTELIYALAGPNTGVGTFNGFYRTNSDGYMQLARNHPNLFSIANNGNDDYDQSSYDNCIAVKPTQSSMIFTGGAIIFKLTNGGSNVTNASCYDESKAGGDISRYVHGDIHDLAYNPLNNYLYAAHDGGVSYSTDDGATWTEITKGITTSMFYSISGIESNQYALLGGLQDNGNKYRGINNSDFTHIGAFDGFFSAISPSDPKRAYYGANHHFLRTDNLGSGSYKGINPKTGGSQWAWRMMTDAVDGNKLFASTSDIDSLYISTNAGDNWTSILNVSGSKGMINCPSNINRMYILGRKGWDFSTAALRRSDSRGNTWSNNLLNHPNLPPVVGGPNQSDIAVSPVNSNKLYLSYYGLSANTKVYMSHDAGETWMNISTNLPNLPIHTIAVDQQENVYAGNDYGVFFKQASSTIWYYYSNGLPRVQVSDLYIHRGSGTLYAATFGRGVWRTSTYGAPCSDNFLHLGGNITGEQFLEGRSIWSNAKLDTFQGTRVNLKAVDSVLLYEGFYATQGVEEFRAYTAPCGTQYPTLYNITEPTTIQLDGLSLPTDIEKGVYPFATIRLIENNNIRELELDLKVPGDVIIRQSKSDGSFEKNISIFNQSKPGKKTIKLNEASSVGFSYLHCIVNGQLVHFQEFE